MLLWYNKLTYVGETGFNNRPKGKGLIYFKWKIFFKGVFEVIVDGETLKLRFIPKENRNIEAFVDYSDFWEIEESHQARLDKTKKTPFDFPFKKEPKEVFRPKVLREIHKQLR